MRSRTTPIQQKQKIVLVVDDDQGPRDTLAAILRGNFLVLRASSGEAALALMKKEDVDLMLLDIRRERVGPRDDLHRAVSSDQGTAGAASGGLADAREALGHSADNRCKTGGFNGRHRQRSATPPSVVHRDFRPRQLATVVNGGRLPRTAL
jgi:CheY-like chemotaxis protein